ncbi:MAG: hypothetical protein WCI51_08310 [Lentisphaerota bacterium]
MFDLGEIGAYLTLNDAAYMSKLKGIDTASNSIFDKIKGYALKAFAAIGGTMFLKSAVSEFNGAEFSVKMYSSALRANGMEVERNAASAKSFAEEMQRLTVHEDDAVLAAMRHGLSLGFTSSQIDEVTKAAIGLGERYGFDLPQAMTLLARAQNGHTEQLLRMGIQLDTTKSKAEQFQQLMGIGAGSFGMATDAAKTNKGALEQLNNTYSDAKENIGEALAPAVTALSQTLKELLLTFNSWDKSTISAIIRTASLVAGLLLAKNALTGLRALYAGVNALIALKTANTIANTAATISNTAANIANGASQKGTAGAAAVGGFLGVNTIAAGIATRGAGMAARGGIMGGVGSAIAGTGTVLGTSVGTLFATGGIAAALGIPTLIATVSAAGFLTGKWIADITGLTQVQERFWGRMRYGLDAIEEKSAGLDKKLQAMNKERQAKLEQKRVDKELADSRNKYNLHVSETDWNGEFDAASAEKKVKMAGDVMTELSMMIEKLAKDDSVESFAKRTELYDRMTEMRKKQEAALQEIDKERIESIQKVVDENKKISDRKLRYLEAGLRSDGKFDMSDEYKLANEKMLAQQRQYDNMRRELENEILNKGSKEKIQLLRDAVTQELLELGRLKEEAKKAADNPREKYTSSMASYAKDIYGDEDMSTKDKIEKITSLNAENRAIYDKIAKETGKDYSRSSKGMQDSISLGKLVKQLEKNEKAEAQKKVVDAIKESTEAIKTIGKGGMITFPDKF